MRLLYVYRTPNKRSTTKVTNWIVYAERIYFKSVFFYNSHQPISTFDNWIKVGELVQIGKPNEYK